MYRSTAGSRHNGTGNADLARELAWAAALHEIGMSVSHHDHHRHSAYLLSHVDAPGFSQSQQRRVADLVLGHRGSLRKLDATLENEATLWPVLCLRLAALLSHARNDVPDGVASLRRTPPPRAAAPADALGRGQSAHDALAGRRGCAPGSARAGCRWSCRRTVDAAGLLSLLTATRAPRSGALYPP